MFKIFRVKNFRGFHCPQKILPTKYFQTTVHVHLCIVCVVLVEYMSLDIFAVFAATTIADHQFFQNANNTAEDRFHWSPDNDVSWMF